MEEIKQVVIKESGIENQLIQKKSHFWPFKNIGVAMQQKHND